MAKGTCRSIEIEQWVSGGGGEPLLGRLAPGCGLAPSHDPSSEYSIGRGRLGAPFATCPPLPPPYGTNGGSIGPAGHPGE